MHALLRCIAGGDFGRCLERILERRGVNPADFARKSGVPYPTLYKILKGSNPSFETLSRIVRALLEEEEFVALIAARYVLEEMEFGENVRVYSATTLEDAIVSAVRAEKDGAKAIVCAPVISSLVEKMVDVPVITIKPDESVMRAVDAALRRVGIGKKRSSGEGN